MRLLFKLTFFFIITLCFTSVYGENNAKLDSLKIELDIAKHDSVKAKILLEIADVHSFNTNYQKSIAANLKALKIFTTLGTKAKESEVLNSIGAQYYYLKNWEKAIEYWSSALKIALKEGNIKDQARYMNNIGVIHEKRGDYDKALEFQINGLMIKQQLGDTLSIASSYNNIANIYTETKKYNSAIEYYHKSLKLKRKFGKENKLSLVLQNLAWAYYKTDKYQPALKYVQEALEIAQKYNDLYNEQDALSKLGDINDAMGNYKKANEYYKLSGHLEDTIMQINNRELIADMDAKYEAERKDNEIALQLVEIEKEKTKVALQTTQKIWFAIGLFLSLILLVVAYRGYKQKQKANLLLEEKNTIIEEKNRDITDSITYASSIQQSILPDPSSISKVIPEHFIFYKPKDIVSGDFYWFHEKENLAFIIAADCTGHGVPGAFVSMLCNNVLNQVIIENNLNDPGEILTLVNRIINASLSKRGASFTSSDGMDCALCVLNKETQELSYAGAYNQLIIINNGDVQEIKADRTPIGGRTDVDFNFKTNKVETKKGDRYYLFSDGYADQFGGPKGKKFMVKKLKQLFADIHELSFKEQHDNLEKALISWKGDIEQVDDILVLGFKM